MKVVCETIAVLYMHVSVVKLNINNPLCKPQTIMLIKHKTILKHKHFV